jgi:hypothetical protein
MARPSFSVSREKVLRARLAAVRPEGVQDLVWGGPEAVARGPGPGFHVTQGQTGEVWGWR